MTILTERVWLDDYEEVSLAVLLFVFRQTVTGDWSTLTM